MESIVYLTVKQLEEEFEQWVDWVYETNGQVMIQHSETLEVIAVMIAPSNAESLGIEIQ